MKNVLITGGAGFIGSNYIKLTLSKHDDWNIVCLDKLSYAGSLDNIEKYFDNNNFTFVKGDIFNGELVNYLFEKYSFDIVINFAAESHVDRSLINSNIFIQSNIAGTDTLLTACVKYGIERYHQISTDEVYGDLPLDDLEKKFTESSLIKPSSPYSVSKTAADYLVLAYFRTYDVPVTISRCSNNYGPNHLPEKLIPLTITRLLEGKKVPIYGNGKNVRDWIYVEDHCKAVDLIVSKGKAGQIYNVGGNSEKSNIDVVKQIMNILDMREDRIEFVKDRLGHDVRYAMDYSKINKELGWKPEVSFDEGIRKTVLWYQNNEKWWRGALERIERNI